MLPSETCPLCGRKIAKPVSFGLGRRSNIYLDRHLTKCRTVSPAEREVFARTGKWPNKKGVDSNVHDA
jgi:hypothetical protein